MTVETTVCNAGHRIKLAHREVQPEGCPVSYVLEMSIEDADGKDSHSVCVFAREPIELYRVNSERRVEMLRSTNVLLEKGLLVRQVDEDPDEERHRAAIASAALDAEALSACDDE
tara:strand:+ start:688 stop:1032 length:345 start_codon:yes stop_codon:yes gene_type:complete